MLAGYALGYATIHSISNQQRDKAATQAILQFTPASVDIVSDDKANELFDHLLNKIKSGYSNRQRIKLLFTNIELYHQLTVIQLKRNIQRYNQSDNMIWADVDTDHNNDTINIDNQDNQTDYSLQLVDGDIVDVISDNDNTPPSTPTRRSTYTRTTKQCLSSRDHMNINTTIDNVV